MRYEEHNLDGRGPKQIPVFDMPSKDEYNFWTSVTNVPCPVTPCDGTVEWAEAGYAPGYRKCNKCGRHFMARGDADAPVLLLAFTPGEE